MSGAIRLMNLPDDEAAALWADLELRPDFSDRDRAVLQAWLAAGAGRADLLRAHRRLVDDPLLATVLAASARPRLRRPAVARGAWALAAGLAAVAVLGGSPLSSALVGEGLVTARGEMRSEGLADGSHVQLNGATKARVRLGRQAREVRLVEGEAYFAVAHDPQRPFSVRSPHGVITAVGTQFDVDRLSDATEVAVYQGRVKVEAAGAKGPPTFLSAGQRARIESGVVLRLTNFEPDAAHDWRSGWIEVADAPLADLITEINRSAATQLAAADAEVRALPISGRFPLRDAEGVAAMVAALHGLEVRREDDRLLLASPQP